MKKIHFLLTLLLVFAVNQLFAQYSITKGNYQISVKKFPSYYVEEGKRTYFIKVVNNVKEFIDSTYIKSNVDLPGWEEVSDEKDAFLTLNITVNSVYFENVDIKERRSEENKKGELIITRKFLPSVRYSFNMKCQFKCPFEVFERRSLLVGDSPVKIYDIKQEFASFKEAQDYVAKDKPNIISDIVNTDIKRFFRIINDAIVEKFYPMEGIEKFQLSFLLDDNSPFLETMLDAQRYLSQEFELINHEKEISHSVPGISVWIEKFQTIAGELKQNDPAQKKAKEEVIRDLVILYYILEDFDNALLYAQILKDTFQSRDGDRLIRNIRTLQNDFETFHKTTRHFVNE